MDYIWVALAGLISGFIAVKIMQGEKPGLIWGLFAFGIVGSLYANLFSECCI
jgi:uncharacterized membrane protein YeaQ/YmgE (transglycosylase-associated protein family)